VKDTEQYQSLMKIMCRGELKSKIGYIMTVNVREGPEPECSVGGGLRRSGHHPRHGDGDPGHPCEGLMVNLSNPQFGLYTCCKYQGKNKPCPSCSMDGCVEGCKTMVQRG